MAQKELHVELRSGAGKGPARRLRAEEKIPAIFYGPYMDKPVALAIESKELTKNLKGGSNVLFTLKANGAKAVDGRMALIRQEQYDPVTDQCLHVDLYEVRMDEKIKVNIRIVLTGKAQGTVEGGILQQILREVEVRCLPTEIPDKIEVDVTPLKIGDSLHIQDVTLPRGVSIVGDVNYTLAAVVPPEQEEVAAIPQAPGTEAEAQPAAEGTEGAEAPKEAAKETKESSKGETPKKGS